MLEIDKFNFIKISAIRKFELVLENKVMRFLVLDFERMKLG